MSASREKETTPSRILRWVTRDRIIFTVGICGVIYETVVERVDRPSLLMLFGAMIGLPFFMRRDRNGNGEE